MDDQDTSSGGDKKATGVRTQSSLLYSLLWEVKQECSEYLSCEAVRVWKLPQIKITFSPHSVVQTDSTEHPFCRRGRREADIGLTCFFCPVVKPPELRSRWRRQIQAHRLRSHTPGEVTVAAAAMAATAAATATAAASPTPPSASSRSRPAAAFTPPSPPHFRVMPRPEAAGEAVGDASRERGNAQTRVKLLPLPAAPGPTHSRQRKSSFLAL